MGGIADSLEFFSADFAKWRWGTLHTCCAVVTRVLVQLRPYMSQILQDAFSKLSAEEKETRKVVGQVFDDATWWERLKLVTQLAEVTDRCRTWGSGCKCCEHVLVAGQRAQCVYKGRRLCEAKAFLEAKLKEFRAIRHRQEPKHYGGQHFNAAPLCFLISSISVSELYLCPSLSLSLSRSVSVCFLQLTCICAGPCACSGILPSEGAIPAKAM